jgi:hypothetical protein
MKRLAGTLALGLAVTGCGFVDIPLLLQPPPTAAPVPARIVTYEGPDGPCYSFVGMDGKLIADRVVGTRIIAPGTNGEPPHNLVVEWPQGYTAQWVEDEIAVRDRDGRLRAVTGTDVFWVGSGPRAPEGSDWSGYWPEMPAGTVIEYCGEDPQPWEGP